MQRSPIPRPTIILAVLGFASFLFLAEGAALLRYGLVALFWIAAVASFLYLRGRQ